ncbi:MAG: hypothetical protein AVDCRST_MAG01-01-4970, partial [uncultured Rubrobacteraceae bacterium]
WRLPRTTRSARPSVPGRDGWWTIGWGGVASSGGAPPASLPASVSRRGVRAVLRA